MKILVINGPNINMLGIREPEIYGKEDYNSLCNFIEEKCRKINIDVDIFQSNIEGEIVGTIQNAFSKYDGIVINPGAYTHYSLAIYDAIKAIGVPTIEVHISNIQAREEYRKQSVTAGACIGQISGFGKFGYYMGVLALQNKLSD